MVFHHLRQLHHRSQEAGLVEPGHPAHPPAPDLEPPPGDRRAGAAIDVLQYQPHLIRFGRGELFVFDARQPHLFRLGQVLRILAPEPLAFVERFPVSLQAISSQSYVELKSVQTYTFANDSPFYLAVC